MKNPALEVGKSGNLTEMLEGEKKKEGGNVIKNGMARFLSQNKNNRMAFRTSFHHRCSHMDMD